MRFLCVAFAAALSGVDRKGDGDGAMLDGTMLSRWTMLMGCRLRGDRNGAWSRGSSSCCGWSATRFDRNGIGWSGTAGAGCAGLGGVADCWRCSSSGATGSCGGSLKVPFSANLFSSSSLSGISSVMGIGPLIFKLPLRIASAFQLARRNSAGEGAEGLISATTKPSRWSMWMGRRL